MQSTGKATGNKAQATVPTLQSAQDRQRVKDEARALGTAQADEHWHSLVQADAALAADAIGIHERISGAATEARVAQTAARGKLARDAQPPSPPLPTSPASTTSPPPS